MSFQEINVAEIVADKEKEDKEFARFLAVRRNERQLIQRIMEIRKELGITQVQLSALVGCSQQEISRMESDKHSPTLKTICQMANVMGYEIILQKK